MKNRNSTKSSPTPIERVVNAIVYLRGEKVMLDSDLADLYQVDTKNLNRAVKRNLERFPGDFMFQLTQEEFDSLRCQSGTLDASRGKHRKYLPFAFTEHGVAMLSSVLGSPHAIQMNILIIRAFVRIRELLASNKNLAARVQKLEVRQKDHASIIGMLAGEIDALKRAPEPRSRPIGFTARIE